ncbi:MAG TPA: hypothetical protein VK116_13630, partial [Planctomycetota bacterium]|nr:hypothetical protein [Planctomycetota bacterium]
ETFCSPVYEDWIFSQVLNGRIEAPGLIEAWRDPMQWETLGAWLSCDWSGNIKPAVDLSKLTTGYKAMIAIGAITRDRAARELTGTKFSKNVQRLARENQALADAMRPLVELTKDASGVVDGSSDAVEIDDESETTRAEVEEGTDA